MDRRHLPKLTTTPRVRHGPVAFFTDMHEATQ